MICVDANVAAKWVLDEEYSEQAAALLAAAIRADVSIVAPPLLRFEVTNVIRQRMRRGELAIADAQGVLVRFLAVPLMLESPETLHRDALAIADIYNLPAAYDAHYLALAQLATCDFWTGDRRLLRAVGTDLPFVKWIGDYREGVPV